MENRELYEMKNCYWTIFLVDGKEERREPGFYESEKEAKKEAKRIQTYYEKTGWKGIEVKTELRRHEA